MIKRSLVTLVLLAAMATPLAAQTARCGVSTFVFDPPRPRAGEPTDLRLLGGCADGCIPHDPVLTFEGSTIVVTLDEAVGGCILSPQPWSELIRIGTLPPGTYALEVRERGLDGTALMARRTLEVAESTRPFTLGPTWQRNGVRTPVAIELQNAGVCTQPPCSVSVTFGTELADVITIDPHRLLVLPPALGGDRVVDVIVKTERETLRARNAFGYFNTDTVFPDPDWFERVLIPVLFNAPGANGAQWRTDVLVKNLGRTIVDPFYRSVYPPPQQTSLGMQPFLPGTSFVAKGVYQPEGMFLFIPRDEDERLAYSIRVRDVSRDAEDHGSEVPVVHDRDTDSVIHLISIPTDPRYRLLLRVYDYDSINTDVFVTLRWADATGEHASVRRVQLYGSPNVPGFTQLDPRTLFGEAFAAESFDVEVSRPGGRLWAFMTVTNNVTQRVTMLTPQ